MEDQGAAAVTTNSSSTKKKFEDKHRKKDPKSWENISKTIAMMDETAKLTYIETKYQAVYNDLRRLNGTIQHLTRQLTVTQKERDHNQAELAKSIVARARLENLCRELQKQNKQIKEENIAKIKEEEERRKEVSLKFANKLSDINNMMDENKEKSDKLREENLKMTAKLGDLYNQFQRREDDIAKMSRQLELERQFSQATLAKMELEIHAEKEMHSKEQAIMKSNLEKSEANCAVLLETVKGLQDHLDIYKHKYDDFESTMQKSANVFDNFQFEIANMTKQVAAFEQEAQSWKNKFHDSMKALLELSEVKKQQEMHIQSLDRKNEQLNKLCRQIQIDRSHYLKLLKSHGIEPTPSPVVQEKTEDELKKTGGFKMTKKEKELQLLKENLKIVQSQLSRMKAEEDAQQKTENQASQGLNEEGAKCVEVQPPEEVLAPVSSPEGLKNEAPLEPAGTSQDPQTELAPIESPINDQSKK